MRHAYSFSADAVSLSNMYEPFAGVQAHRVALFLAFIMSLISAIRTFSNHVAKRLPESTAEKINKYLPVLAPMPREEFHPALPTHEFTNPDFTSSVREKVCTLEENTSVMPYEKEELLNAAVRRVDALEAELIATKKV